MLLTTLLLLIARIIVFCAGVWLVVWTVNQALRSFVLPRSDRAFLTSKTFRIVSFVLTKRFRDDTPFAQKDRVLAMLSPVAMFLLPIVWLSLLIVGYAGLYWAINPDLSIYAAISLSGSSLLTLGFAFQDTLPMILLGFTQAALGMMLVALLIGYLPTMYSAFSQRESMVTKLEALAGSPPNSIEVISRLDYVKMLHNPEEMRTFWVTWQDWFVQIEENHTTLAPMNFFRSPKPDRHWVTAAGTILDTAALIASSVQTERALQSGLVLRTGYLALRTIADYFQLDYDPNPKPNDPISIDYEEFITALEELTALGIPLHADWDECWDHFAGWRVNYDEVLLQLARITVAPYSVWSSDRALKWHPSDVPPIREFGRIKVRARKDIVADSPNL